MALAALLQATMEHLAAELGLEVDRDISCQDSDQPPPYVGEVHYVVHATDWSWPGQTDNDTLDEQYAISVSITQRTPSIPPDRRMSRLFLDRLGGMEKRCRQVMVAVHLSTKLFGMANELCEGTIGLTEMLRWVSTDAKPRDVGPEWFFASDEKRNDTVAGWVMSCHFNRARRLQAIFQSGTAVDDVE